MKIATWNIGSGININNYKEDLFDITPELKTDDSVMQIIAKQIKDNNVDVIAIQEIITTKSFEYAQKLSEQTGLKFYLTYENSPCHLVKNTMFGIAIFSKYPLTKIEEKFLTNPNLTKTTEKGTYTSHDKGYMIARVECEKPFYISCTQFLPFHRFNADIENYKFIADEYQTDNKKYNAICCGDFNAIQGLEKLKNVLKTTLSTCTAAFDEITTVDGKKCDNILVPNAIKIKNKKIFKNDLSSDHYMCMIEI